jgi:TolA-binding protein
MKKLLRCLLAALVVAGCGENNSSREKEPMAVEDTVFGDQVEQIQRAEDRAKEMEGRMQDLNKQLEGAEGQPQPDPDQ